jgi:hypothetical protein
MRQAAYCENLFHIDPYKVIDEETGCLVLPSIDSSILRFQNLDDHVNISV